MKKNKILPGFTLIELLVVIAIIGILASLSVISLNGTGGRQQEDIADDLVKMIYLARDHAIIRGQPHALDYDEHGIYLLVYDRQEIKLDADTSTSVPDQATKVKAGKQKEAQKETQFVWRESPLAKPLMSGKKFEITFPDNTFQWRKNQEASQKTQDIFLNELMNNNSNSQQSKSFKPRMIFWPAGYVEPAGKIEVLDLDTNTLVILTIDFQGRVEVNPG